MKISAKSIKRFWERVDKGDDCWEWDGAISDTGYGKACIGHQKTMNAHRLAYLLTFGPIPEGLWVCHHCDNRSCVNPAHLFLGTPADNNADMAKKGRARGCPRPGESNPAAKLTVADVKAIRSRFVAGGITRAQLAKEHSISDVQIGNIISGKRWTHIQ